MEKNNCWIIFGFPIYWQVEELVSIHWFCTFGDSVTSIKWKVCGKRWWCWFLKWVNSHFELSWNSFCWGSVHLAFWLVFFCWYITRTWNALACDVYSFINWYQICLKSPGLFARLQRSVHSTYFTRWSAVSLVKLKVSWMFLQQTLLMSYWSHVADKMLHRLTEVFFCNFFVCVCVFFKSVGNIRS